MWALLTCRHTTISHVLGLLRTSQGCSIEGQAHAQANTDSQRWNLEALMLKFRHRSTCFTTRIYVQPHVTTRRFCSGLFRPARLLEAHSALNCQTFNGALSKASGREGSFAKGLRSYNSQCKKYVVVHLWNSPHCMLVKHCATSNLPQCLWFVLAILSEVILHIRISNPLSLLIVWEAA